MTDVNDEAVSDWVSKTTVGERVWEVVKQESNRQSVEEIARRGRVSTDDARQFISQLETVGIVDETGGAYRVPGKIQVALEACRMIERVESDQIEERIDDLRSTTDPNDTTRRNRAIAEVAVSIRDAVRVDREVRAE